MASGEQKSGLSSEVGCAFVAALVALILAMLALAGAYHIGRAQGYNEVICLPAWDEPVRRDA